jgi:hypothetical protein
MASQGAGRWDVGRVRLQGENSEARRDELEIFGLAKEDRQRGASFPNLIPHLFPNLFLKPTRDFQMA